jgi:hypothetical protein
MFYLTGANPVSELEGKRESRAALTAKSRKTKAAVSSPRLSRMCRVGLLDRVATPTVERVIEREPGFELSEVVDIHP